MKKTILERFFRAVTYVMKINAIILLFICSLSSIAMAGNSYGQSVLTKTVTVKLKQVPLPDALERISDVTGVRIIYTGNSVDNNLKISITAKNEKLEDILNKLLSPNQLTFTEIEGSVLVRPAPAPPVQRAAAVLPITISGTVVDDRGLPLVGVSVKLVGSSVGTVTNIDGKFHLQVPDVNAVLSFSYLGFETQKLPVGSQTVIKITMVPSANSLSAVVVIGYGTTTKRELTSAISTVKAEDFNAGVVSTPSDLLEGKVAGLNITNDGNPNGTATVTLRGPSTLRASGSSPFYVIDGVPDADYNTIAPADIASIDVLKDASAAAIYGTRAANGVIIITTKKGKPGKLVTTYSAYAGIEKISNQFKVATADQLRAYVKANGQAFSSANDNGGNTNWEQQVERNSGFSQNHSLSFRGGSDQTTFNASINYLEDEGIVKTSSLDRLTTRLDLSQKALNNKLKLDFSLSNSITTANETVSDQYESGANGANPNLFQAVVEYLPTRTVYNANGTLNEDPTLHSGYNPLGLINNNTYNNKVNRLLLNAKAELDLPFDIKYNLNAAYQDISTVNNTYNNSFSELAPNLNGVASRSYDEDTKKLFENYFSYEHNWNDKHKFKALVGYSFDETKTGDSFTASSENFISDATSYYNLSAGNPPAGYIGASSGSPSTLRLISFYSRLNYSFEGKYLLEASIRRDGSNAFGANHQWAYFPAVSAAWRIIDESFMKNQSLFNELKLRVGYGVTGNALGFSPYTPLTLYGPTGRFFYYTPLSGNYYTAIGPTQDPNPNLKWESTATLNGGVDFGILKGRLTGSIDAYYKNTTNLIYGVNVSTVTNLVGYKVENIGSMSNKGVEISLDGTPIKGGDFTWESYGNIAFNKNKLTSLGVTSKIYAGDPEGPGQSGIYTSIIQPGYPLGEFYTLKWLGVINGVSTYLGANGKPTTAPTSTDQTYAGSAEPTYTFGWGNNLKYKAFSLNFFFRGQGGNKIMDASLANFNTPTQASQHNVPVLTLSEPVSDYNANLYSTRYIESGAFIRLSNATLSYKVNMHNNYIKGLRFYVTGTNLFVITKYKGVDPELNLSLNNQQSGQFIGVDNNNFYPKTRDYLVGVQADL